MMILAIDTSSDSLLVAVADENRVLAEFNGGPDRRHSEGIVSAIDTVLKDSDIAFDRLDALAVMSGPGSFTGLRVGIATALGLAQAWQKPILSVANFDLARLVWCGIHPAPVIIIHCRGEEFFVAADSGRVEVMTAAAILEKFRASSLAGAGAERLAKLSDPAHPVKIVKPPTWSAGAMAQLVATNKSALTVLDPINLDVNYMMKSQPEIRRAQTHVEIGELSVAELADVLEIERDAFADPWESGSFEADIANEHVITLAVRSTGRTIGYLSCIALEDYGYIANVAVHRDHRSQGIGQKLLAELLHRLELRRISDLVLDVRVSNLAAIKFYERYGFQVLTRRKGFYSKPPEDSFTMLRIGKK